MTATDTTASTLMVAIDISKHRHEVLIGVPGKKRHLVSRTRIGQVLSTPQLRGHCSKFLCIWGSTQNQLRLSALRIRQVFLFLSIRYGSPEMSRMGRQNIQLEMSP